MVNLTGGQPLPTVAGDFAAAATITALSVRHSAGASFVNSDVAANNLGKIDLGTVRLSNGTTTFGLGTRFVASLTFRDEATGKTVRAKNVNNSSTFASLLASMGINPQNFVVRVI